MLAKGEGETQHELTENIYHLSKALLETDEEKEEVASKLRLLYQGGFRHNYSDFFPIILEIARQDNDYSIDYLSENLESLRVFVENDYVSNNKRYTGLYPILENCVTTSISRSAGGAIILKMSIGSRIFLPKRIP